MDSPGPSHCGQGGCTSYPQPITSPKVPLAALMPTQLNSTDTVGVTQAAQTRDHGSLIVYVYSVLFTRMTVVMNTDRAFTVYAVDDAFAAASSSACTQEQRHFPSAPWRNTHTSQKKMVCLGTVGCSGFWNLPDIPGFEQQHCLVKNSRIISSSCKYTTNESCRRLPFPCHTNTKHPRHITTQRTSTVPTGKHHVSTHHSNKHS